jgi:hypothetical protein
MKTKIMLGVLIMAAMIGSSVGVGYAGSGGEGGPGGIFLYQCFEVDKGTTSPPSPPAVLEINDQFTDTTTEEVGKLKLVCAPTDWSVANPDVFQPTVVEGGDHLTCYEVSQAQATTSVVILADAFGVRTETITVEGRSKFVCAFATKECVSGCPVLDEP